MAPNIALRWKPRPAQIAPDAREIVSADSPSSGGGKKGMTSQQPAPGGGKADPPAAKVESQRVWVKDGDFVRPIEVTVGPSDGSMTEIKGEGVEKGMRVIIGESRTAGLADDGDATTNPFLPKIRPGGTPKSK
jgi:hypothetical protein